MIPTQLLSTPPVQLQISEPLQSSVNSFWHADHVREQLKNLRNTVDLVKGLQKELEGILLLRVSSQNGKDFSSDHSSDNNLPPSANDSVLSNSRCLVNESNDTPLQISEMIKQKRISLTIQESLSLEAANSLILTLKDQLGPLNAIISQASPWEQRSMAASLAQKLQKAKRNKHWKRRKRRRVAELLRKEREGYDKADQDADDWRTREIAKDIAKRKVESMKAIAAVKANEERRRLESELELVLVVEKLQELRSIRIEKLKKQGMGIFFQRRMINFLKESGLLLKRRSVKLLLLPTQILQRMLLQQQRYHERLS
ncbi:U11/U12 small nuclear ribonucleoprotein 59 kDa protein [Iris pallida]|uniref:U11/U12 small nuclear ribonucleoprotein 59 kDa protein n=1 Tax=Iris pallida TaxID=29817 RepID=A0AAX6DR16_IRIPA|nr:U11/U12 small nuclear ribonucleoprotein 59 kDa protein [Iris pallida]